MYNNILLSWIMSLIPMLAIGFVLVLLIYKFYIKIRSRFNIAVNCWFCNHNTKVPYLNGNSWTCPLCDQYNGFNKDGDYNREIYEQLDCSANSEKRYNVAYGGGFGSHLKLLSNGFCDICNEAQRLKVEKLAQFEPKNESRFDEELKVYQAQLEDQYRLCSTCDRHLNKVLREKKKMVLGSKFLDFIIKGAEQLKQPHLNQIEHVIQQKRKQRLRSIIILVTLLNVCCLLSVMPTLKKENVILLLGDTVGQPIFIATSHFMALTKVLGSYINSLTQNEFLVKIYLFSRTIFMMLMYSMGLSVSHISFALWFVGVYPLLMLSLAFVHNIVDGLRLSRYTSMIGLWSLFAAGFIGQDWICSPQVLMLFSCLCTLAMVFTSKPEPSPKLHDSTANSFHKIYSEDYFSDDETMSILSQQLNGSSVSMRSVKSNKSFQSNSPMQHDYRTARLTKSPLTSSVFSLNQQPRSQLSPNSSYRSYGGEENQTSRSVFATPMPMPPLRQGLFASNFELNTHHNGQSIGFNGSNTNSSTILNSSFVEPRCQNNNASFFTAANTSTFAIDRRATADQTFVQPGHVTSGIYSPFSASTSAVYQQTQNSAPARKLLSPTRFSTTNLTNHHAPSNSSWLSGGYFNQRQSISEIPRNGLLLQMAGNAPMTAMEDGLSRASSHSSGFESQHGGRPNMSRENSQCPEFNDMPQRSLIRDNINSFQPIDTPGLGTFSPRPSVFSNPNLNSSFTSNASHINNGELWKQSAFTRRPINSTSSLFSRNTGDSFNLRKINEELPTINRGTDMFQQWKEGQIIS